MIACGLLNYRLNVVFGPCFDVDFCCGMFGVGFLAFVSDGLLVLIDPILASIASLSSVGNMVESCFNSALPMVMRRSLAACCLGLVDPIPVPTSLLQ